MNFKINLKYVFLIYVCEKIKKKIFCVVMFVPGTFFLS